MSESSSPTPVDPASVPSARLTSGARIPAVGFGTFGSDHATPDRVADAVVEAARLGYRHFDCAEVYGNQPEIGRALARVRGDGVARSELFVTSKLWNDHHAPADVAASCEQSLADLGLDELDLFLVHWPFRNHHPPGCDVGSRSPDARPFEHDRFMETWGAVERLVDAGKVRHAGTSNMTRVKLEGLLRDARVRPAVNEMELHPHFQQPELFAYVRSEGLVPVGFCPLGSPNRPERDRTPEDSDPLRDPVLQELAAEAGLHPATLCVRWAVQRGQVPIPFSLNPRNMAANLAAAAGPQLPAEAMERLAAIDRGCRLIKGQVFLWEGAPSWHALWDEEAPAPPV